MNKWLKGLVRARQIIHMKSTQSTDWETPHRVLVDKSELSTDYRAIFIRNPQVSHPPIGGLTGVRSSGMQRPLQSLTQILIELVRDDTHYEQIARTPTMKHYYMGRADAFRVLQMILLPDADIPRASRALTEALATVFPTEPDVGTSGGLLEAPTSRNLPPWTEPELPFI